MRVYSRFGVNGDSLSSTNLVYLKEVLQAIGYLIAIFPMASLNDGIVKFAPIEELVECIFRLVIQISLEFTAEEELPRNHISFLSLDWLCELW